MRRLRWTLAGGLGVGALVFGIGMALPSVLAISKAEGAYAMGVAFVWTPIGLVVGAVLGFIFAGSNRS
jgi:hypothetical protein